MKARKHFFFKKKKQKTFGPLAAASQERARLNWQKFFGSFFQKRTRFLASLLLLPATADAQLARPAVDAPALAALGPYSVGVTMMDMAEAPDRKLTTTVWYPSHAAGGEPITYHTAMPGPDGHPVAFTVPGIAVAGAAAAAGRFPLVILAHGYDNTPELLSWLGENLASKGYVVAAPAFRDPQSFDMPGVMAAFEHRPLDVAFVAREARRHAQAGQAPFDHADPDRVALIGYSMGGYGVITAAGAPLTPGLVQASGGMMAPYVAGAPHADQLTVAGLKAVVSISPANRLGPLAMWTQAGLAAIRTPTFFIAGSQDHVVGYDPGVRNVFEGEIHAPRYLLTFREAGHNIALCEAPPNMRGRLWDQDWFEDPVWRKTRLAGIEAHFITAFLDRTVKGDASKAAYIDGLIANSDDGTWTHPPADYAAVSPGPPAATLWKGFQQAHAAGMMLEHRPAAQ